MHQSKDCSYVRKAYGVSDGKSIGRFCRHAKAHRHWVFHTTHNPMPWNTATTAYGYSVPAPHASANARAIVGLMAI